MTDPTSTDPPMHRPLARSRAPRRIPRWAMAGIAAAPLLCLLVGLALTLDSARLLAEAKPAIGIVSSISARTDENGLRRYRANIRYHGEDGREFEGAFAAWTAIPFDDIGDEVAILYTDADPARLRPDNFVSRYGTGPFLMGFGGLSLAIVLWFGVEVARQPSPHWFGPPPLPPQPAGGAMPLAGSVRRERPGGSWVARFGRRIPEWVWWAAMGCFGLIVLLGLWIFVDAAIFFSDADRTQGEVIAVAEDPRSTEGVTYIATVRYLDRDGNQHEGRTHISLATYDFAEGETVEIYHSPGRPGEVRIADFISIWFPGLFFTLFGGLFIILVLWVRDRARTAVLTDWQGGEVLLRVEDEAAALRAGSRGGPADTASPAILRRDR